MLNDLHPVARAVAEAIHVVMMEGQAKHGETWRTRPDGIDLKHARDHLLLLAAADGREDHLGHALARLAIVVARRERSAAGEPP